MPFFDRMRNQTASEAPEESVKELESVRRVESQGSTVIARGVTVTGTLTGEGVVQISGTVEGKVSVGHLTVTPTGKIVGPVEADVIRIGGVVDGPVTCRDHLQLERTGSIEGDVTTGTFVIENGGRLNGNTTMTGRPEEDQSIKDPELEELKFGRNYKGDDGEED